MECSACNILANVGTSSMVCIIARYQVFYFTAGDIQHLRAVAINLFVVPAGDGQGGTTTVDIAGHLAILCGASHCQACAAIDVDGTIQDAPVQVDGEGRVTGLRLHAIVIVNRDILQQSDRSCTKIGSSGQRLG